MDALVDAQGTWAAAWDYYDFAGLDLDDGTASLLDAADSYYGTDPDMMVDPLWNQWPDQPYYDPTNMPDADPQDAYIASSLICGSKCLTVDEFQHSTTVASFMQELYNLSMSDPIHREYGAYLWRDSQNHIHMGAAIPGLGAGEVDMGYPPSNSIAAIHTHPTLGVVGWGDTVSMQPEIDNQDQWIYENLHEIGVVVTQHREIYYRPSDGVHSAEIAGVIWAAYDR